MGLADSLKKKLGIKPKVAASFEERVTTFWAWWGKNADAYAASISAGKASDWAERIAEAVAAIDPDLAWETGPGRAADHHFAFSSEGDPIQRILVERILSQGPEASAAWEYYGARQRSDGDPVYSVKYDDGLVIDYKHMLIQIERDDDWRCLDLTLHHPEFENIDEDRAKSVVYLFIDRVLGEDEVERWIRYVDVSETKLDDGVGASALQAEVDSMANDGSDDSVSIVELTDRETQQRSIASWSTALKRLDYLWLDHHIEIVITIPNSDERGLCDNAELEFLASMEDELVESLDSQAVWFGHVTGYGKRTIRIQAVVPGPTTALIDAWILRHPEYAIDYTVKSDPAWENHRDLLGCLPEMNS